AEAIEAARLWLSYLPLNWRGDLPSYEPEAPAAPLTAATIPERESQPFDIHDVIDGLVDDDSFFEVKELFAPELVVGLGRMAGETVGIVANNSMAKGGVLFTDSADKAARFIWLCDAYSIPLIYLADVPGFMIGSEVERGGIIRHGAKMVSAVASATVPQFCVIVRKAYGAGLYAMGGPGFAPDATIALPTARIAVMGPEAAVNAVYANKIAQIEADEGEAARDDFIAARRAEYEEDVDLERLAADLVLDQVIEPEQLRDELLARLRHARGRDRTFSERRRGIPPV
ncbi:acyl-CoA carboxylase subunit beta, partial [Janibacter hoylei]